MYTYECMYEYTILYTPGAALKLYSPLLFVLAVVLLVVDGIALLFLCSASVRVEFEFLFCCHLRFCHLNAF